MANHGKVKLVRDPEPEPKGPLMQWVTLFRAGDSDYRVATLLTQGLPEDAEVGETSIDTQEAEERFRIAAADTLDLGTEVMVTPPSKQAPPPPLDEGAIRAKVIDEVLSLLQRLRRPQ